MRFVYITQSHGVIDPNDWQQGYNGIGDEDADDELEYMRFGAATDRVDRPELDESQSRPMGSGDDTLCRNYAQNDVMLT
ncbi:MAG: hypothetical protein ACRED9_01280 [Caulobacteraceae bacterium]